MELHHANELAARSLAYFDKTLVLLTGDRPGFDRDHAIAIGRFLQENGFYVYECTPREFMEKNLALLGAMLLLPHAQSVPAEFAQAMKHYWLQGGQILVLGGPLFCDLIEWEDGAYVKKELPRTVLDAQHSGKTGDIVIEGLVPTHKVFLLQDVQRLQTQPQPFTAASVLLPQPKPVVCPAARPHGLGYGMEHKSRYIPLIEACAANGGSGAAAFIMLNDTRGHLRFTNGSRPGSVSATVMGSSIGCIGLQTQKLMELPGMPELILDMTRALLRGLYLYEAGADKFVCKPGEVCTVGAKILNTTQDFANVTVRFTVQKDNRPVFIAEKRVLAMPRTYTECTHPVQFGEAGGYTVRTELFANDALLDTVTQEVFAHVYRPGASKDFVRVQGRDFVLDKKQWNLFGISYWPLYFPNYDREEYWMGWLDKSNYDPIEVEKDLVRLEQMGMNCLFTRLDGNIFGRSIEQLKDFMLRLERHHMRLSLSYANATNPLHYSPDAFHALMEQAELYKNPTLFGHDISWETGHQFFMENYLPQWRDGWERWICERYGSVENAERSWGIPVDRDAAGAVITPPKRELEFDGPWRVKICAFRRYMDDFLSRVWNDAVRDMRSVDPDHIIGYRMGCFYKDTGPALTATNKHTDYSSLEGYSFMEDENGRYASQCLTKVSQLLTGGKPVVWVEYGNNLIGSSGNSAWSALMWERETLTPPAHRYHDQLRYYEQFFRMFRACDIAGSVPWWYAGGFRRVECSDCGLVSPDGTLRPAARAYEALGKEWLLPERKHKTPTRIVSYDPDLHAAGWGKFYLGSGPIDRNEYSWAAAEGRTIPGVPEYGIGVHACRSAEEDGAEIAFTTPGFGTTSANTPLLAVGNVPYCGNEPMKYLDGEFNTVALIQSDGSLAPVKNGAKIRSAETVIGLRTEAGNLREATWLAGSQTGDVVLQIRCKKRIIAELPMQKDTPYLADAVFEARNIVFPPDEPLQLRLSAKDRCEFGEIWTFELNR